MLIAIDFDGTVVEHKYPNIGKEIPFATATLRKLIERGHNLVLWTVREGELLEEAVKWCNQHGIVFYAVNKNFGEETTDNQDFSRKIKADIFIDDRNIGGLPDWGIIYDMIENDKTYEECILEQNGEEIPKKKRWKLF